MIKILLVEDDIIWQANLKLMFEELGYEQFFIASSLFEAQKLIDAKQPNIVCTNVKLPDGIATSYFKVNHPQCPIIFITEIADKDFVDEILKVPHSTFFVKPFHALTLYSAIKSALNSIDNKPLENALKVLKVPIRYRVKVDLPLSSIFWIKVEGNYCTIQANKGKYLQKISLPSLKEDLDENFIQIHKSVIVNKIHITNTNLVKNIVSIQGVDFPIGRSFRRELIDSLY